MANEIKEMSREQILEIPKMRASGLNNKQIAEKYGCRKSYIEYWIRRLKLKGYQVPAGKMGRPSKI